MRQFETMNEMIQHNSITLTEMALFTSSSAVAKLQVALQFYNSAKKTNIIIHNIFCSKIILAEIKLEKSSSMGESRNVSLNGV